MDWWQTIIILSVIGLISVMIGMTAGIPLSNIIVRRREKVSTDKNQISSQFASQYTKTDEFDELLKKYGLFEPKTTEQGNEKTSEIENDEAETTVGQVDPIAIDRILLELEKNLKLSIEPRLDKLEPFQTDTWDTILGIPNMLTVDLKWELTQAYLDMHAANNIVWFHTKFDSKSPELGGQYVGICSQISDRLGKIIPVLETTKQIVI